MAARTLEADETDSNPARGSKLNSIVEVNMANVLIQRLLATGLLTISMQTAFAGDATGSPKGALFRHPAMAGGTAESANLMLRVERAL
jgi:hypothetical protein